MRTSLPVIFYIIVIISFLFKHRMVDGNMQEISIIDTKWQLRNRCRVKTVTSFVQSEG